MGWAIAAAFILFLSAVALSAGLVHLGNPVDAIAAMPFFSFCVWFIGLVLIAGVALADRTTKRHQGVDLTIVSEFVVAWGIFGLLLNIAAGIFVALPQLTHHTDAFDFERVMPIVQRFGEGLISSAVAPLAAVVLRWVGSNRSRIDLAEDPTAALRSALQELQNAVATAGDVITTASNNFASSTSRLSASAGEFERALAGKGHAISQEIAGALAALSKVATELEAISTNAGSASEHVDALAESARDARKYLHDLQATMDNVTNFVRNSP